MRGKRLSERTMGHAKLETLVDYYLADMQRRGCAQDSVTTNCAPIVVRGENTRYNDQSWLFVEVVGTSFDALFGLS